MNEDIFQGYKGKALKVLKKYNVQVWDDADIETTRGHFSGKILPRAENTDSLHIVLKLSTGYNIGVHVSTIITMSSRRLAQPVFKIPEKEIPYTKGLPRIKLLGTGGTIASRLDYRTGAVIPAFSPSELYASVPELTEICNIETEEVLAVFSENMSSKHYIILAKKIEEAVKSGIDGIVISHGTDTLQHTGAALTFMCQNLPVPIVLVGSQRSSDRPSSDAALNLMHAATAAAHGDIAEVLICMAGTTSDDYGLLHKATRARKMHSSYRSAFRSINDTPMAKVTRNNIELIKKEYNKKDKNRTIKIIPTFDDRVTMLYYYPGMKPDILEAVIDNGYKGIVWVGAGLGHINKEMYPAVEKAHTAGIHQYMTLQTIWGYVNLFVYDTGRDIMARGIIPCGNMLPEVAYIKLGWALGQTDDAEEVKRIMLTPINDEITQREPYNAYLVYQGGIEEVEEFIRKVRK
ncbi:MAG TPA: Glu-tRNA(Gln) amidotransferase subunit GatD [Bacteroidales bacterium]|nr:Glu-tRNA(Gln) amidotransferase subunit GatD [Bacteroidales bacterium]HOR82528.1 Glu-tRNA(Gln) amidotransferase subunit GatD [Bacteroidales bacterium]HPJ91262.1 Glu-tRNA(Gln) amidotransferase subunit GatD [Bacteroidales bacterium]